MQYFPYCVQVCCSCPNSMLYLLQVCFICRANGFSRTNQNGNENERENEIEKIVKQPEYLPRELEGGTGSKGELISVCY